MTGGIEKAVNAIFTIGNALLVVYLCENRTQRLNAIISVKVHLSRHQQNGDKSVRKIPCAEYSDICKSNKVFKTERRM